MSNTWGTEGSRAKDMAYIIGGVEVGVADFARAIAVHDGCGEEMQDEHVRAIRMQDANDILDRAFRFAQQRRTGFVEIPK